MKRIYLAGPFFSEEQVARIEKIEQSLEHNETVENYFSPRHHQETTSERFSAPWANEIYHQDMDEIKKCDVIVALLDFEHQTMDPGTAYELGVAKMLDIPVIAFQEKDEAVNLMITETVRAYTNSIEMIQTYDFDTCPTSQFVGEYI
ncbi:MAG: nucleoside 2-deoxyribosyltransferase [Enterococcus sp.]